jgi:hypothetical protein
MSASQWNLKGPCAPSRNSDCLTSCWGLTMGINGPYSRSSGLNGHMTRSRPIIPNPTDRHDTVGRQFSRVTFADDDRGR